ncbi:hypothetical protein AB4Z21_18920 [Paenibacillus sp. MCAF20]
MINRKSIGGFDFILFSIGKSSSLHFAFADIETDHYPSISFIVHVIDHSFRGSIDIWIEKDILQEFYDDLKQMIMTREGRLNLTSMSPEELELSIISENKKQFYINYSIKKTRPANNKLLNETLLSGSFEYDSEYLYELEQDIRNIMKLFK